MSAEYYPVSQILRITFPQTSPASGGSYNYYSVSADEWQDFQSASSPGRFINDVLSAHSYGMASAAPAAQVPTSEEI